MAALAGVFDWLELERRLQGLPHWARPVFLRLTDGIARTETFKPKRAHYVAQGFDPGLSEDRLFVFGENGYRRLDARDLRDDRARRVAAYEPWAPTLPPAPRPPPPAPGGAAGMTAAEAVKVMDQPGVAGQSNGHARPLQRLRVSLALVAQGIAVGDMDQRRRQAGKIRRRKRRDAGVAGVEAVDAIGVPIGAHRRLVDQMPLGQREARGGAGERVHHRAEQKLQRRREAGLRRGARGERGELAAGGIAADADAAGRQAEARGIAQSGRQRGDGVVVGGGKAGFRRAPVVDGDDAASGAGGERGGERVVAVEIAGDEAAAVEIDEAGQHVAAASGRRIEAQAQGCGRRSRARLRRGRRPAAGPRIARVRSQRRAGAPRWARRVRRQRRRSARRGSAWPRGRGRERQTSRRRTSAAMLATLAKFSGVRSASGMAMSKAASISSISRTAATEVRPASRRSAVSGSPLTSARPGAAARRVRTGAWKEESCPA